MDRVDYVNTFIAVAPDNRAVRGVKPPARRGSSTELTVAIPTVAALTYELINAHPYELTSGDVIFTVMAVRRGIPDADRAAAREEFYAEPRACLRSSDLGKRYGWGIHADADGRLALYGVESHEYGRLLDGRDPFGQWVAVTRAMRSSG
ncbi:hypothetical protein ABIB15_000158 [Marisediminicola sp. UYEF4]|uniref:DUF6157 family protein n=1 Tax=Marisediminicola sp. UYEF4 TaxID=1756384 RepID=UPI00339AED07